MAIMAGSVVPVIDLFAGPGGLGEGFSRFRRKNGDQPFQLALSIEKDEAAHRTLLLRSFLRKLRGRGALSAYADAMRDVSRIGELFGTFPAELKMAQDEAWRAELGSQEF